MGDETSFAKRLTESGIIGAVFLYFTGWMYISRLFFDFGLSAHVIEISPYNAFIYAYDVLFTGCRAIVTIPIAVGLLYHVATGGAQTRRAVIAYALVTALAFPVLHLIATRRADRVAAEIRSGYGFTVTTFLRPAALGKYPANVLADLQSPNIRLITVTADRVFLVWQPPGEQGQLPRARTYVLPTADVVINIVIPNTRKVDL